MPTHRGIHGWRWEECDTCGFPWPLHTLKRDYTNYRKCPRCYDEQGFAENREDLFLSLEEITEEDDTNVM